MRFAGEARRKVRINFALQRAELKGGRIWVLLYVGSARRSLLAIRVTGQIQVDTLYLRERTGFMSNIDELQGRITAAMDRIAKGVDTIAKAGPVQDPETVQALADERVANEQLRARVRALKTRADAEMADMRAEVEESQARMGQLDVELQRVRRANQQLQETSVALREANAEGVGDADLINKAMLAELEGLRAARAADVAEAGAILAALTPLVENAAAPVPQEDA